MAAPVYVAEIAGTDRAASHVLLEGFSIREVTNGVDTMTCRVGSVDASLRPVKRQEVLIKEDAVPIFGGVIRAARESGFGGFAAGHDAIVTEIEVDDFSQYFQRRFLSFTFGGGTLKAFAIAFTAFFSSAPFSITLDAAQVDGPTLPAIVFENERGDDCLNFVAALTAKFGAPFQWRIDFSKVWGFYQASSTPAPFDVIESQFATVPESTTGDIVSEPTDDTYANKIIVVGGSGKVVTTTDVFTGNGVLTTFGPLKFKLTGPLAPPPATSPPTVGAVGYAVVVVGGVNESIGVTGTTNVNWWYDPSTREITRQIGGAVPNGVTVSIMYDGQLLFTVTAQDNTEIAANGLWEDKVIDEQLEDMTLAQAVADAELARRLVQGKVVRFQTRRTPGPKPGQSLTITVPKRNLSGSFTVVDVTTEYEEGSDVLLRTVTCTSSVFEHWRQTLTRWWSPNLGGQGGPGLAPAGASAVPGLPLWSNQFNRNYTFGGNAAWTFVEPELLARLVGPDAEVLMRGQLGGLDFGVPNLPAALAVRIGSVSTTRLYLSAQAAPYTPATFKGAWDDTSFAITKKLTFNKPDTTNAHAQASETSSNNQWDLLNYRGVTDGLTAQTIGGTLSAMIVAFAGAFANHLMYWHIHLYATVGDSDSVRHTFINDYRENAPSNDDFPAPVNWGGFPLGTDNPVTGTIAPVSLTSGSIQTGDRLVIEIGVVARNSLTGSFTSSIGYGARSDRSDATFRSAIDTSSWIDLNLANPTSTQVAQSWNNIVAGEDDAITLETPDDGKAYFKNDKGIYINGILFAGPGGGTAPLNSPQGFTLLTASPASPVNDSWWVERLGTSPMVVALKARISGTTYTVAAITV